MDHSIRKVEYYYITVSDKPGEGARVLSHFRDAGVNLIAFHAFPSARKAQLDFVPADSGAFKTAARAGRFKISRAKTAFVAEGPDRVGAAAEVLEKLGAAKINVIAMDGLATGGRFALLFWVEPRQVKKAATVLGAS